MRDKVDGLEQRRIIAEFAERRKKIYILLVLVAALSAGTVFLLVNSQREMRPAAVVLILIIFVIALLGNLRVWRCPHCDGHLGKLYIGLDHPKFCPVCGVRLIEEDERRGAA